jgi:hypothetical protein
MTCDDWFDVRGIDVDECGQLFIHFLKKVYKG